jgi:diguanylate cyclase (GGDEF)-like protein/PAS domain S-box-containing protein
MTLLNYINHQPLAVKLTAACVLTSILSLTIAMVSLTLYDKSNHKSLIKKEISLLASVISHQSVESLVFDDQPSAQNNLTPLTFKSTIIGACIYRASDDSKQTTIVATYPNAQTYCPTTQPHDIKFIEPAHERFIDFIHPIKHEGDIIGYVYIKSSLSDLNSRTAQSINVLLAIILFATIVTLCFSKVIYYRLLSPLKALGKTAQRITAIDDYSIRAEKINEDEVGSVVDSFNQILNVIEHEHDNLRESEEKIRLISASSKVGIFQLDSEGKCIFVNEEMSLITGLPKEQIIAKSWLSVVANEDRDILESKLNCMITTHNPININCKIDGASPKWVTGHVGLLHGNNNEIVGYLGSINDVTDIRQAQTQLEQTSFYDSLTGLANRLLFRNRLEHVLHNLIRGNHSSGLILIDLDHFKEINDSLGHDAGDTLLTIISGRLQKCVRSSDTVARLGGDEFAIILTFINNSIVTSSIAEKILDAINEPITLKGSEFKISASLGIAIAPDDAKTAEDLIKQADMALYRAKDLGRNNYQFFTSEMNDRLVAHLDLVRDLRIALEKEEFHLVFQSQIDLSTRKLTGFEALIRWVSPSRGFVAPDQFIHTAENTGLIIPIGRLVITKACQQLSELLTKGIIDDSVVMTVNISAKQFQDADLVDYIKQELKTYNIPPSQFEIELTESVLMENIDEALVKLKEIQFLGIIVSIDDFGTGYSSLGYLKQLPVNIIKVDRSFVYDIPANKDDMEITAAVIAMAHKLNYKVVAEGVETQEQLQFLHRCHCDYGQGYLFSKPLSRDDLIDYCVSYNPQQDFATHS